MPKRGATKLQISITIDQELAKKLDDFCKKNHGAKRSTIIEEALKKFLEEKER